MDLKNLKEIFPDDDLIWDILMDTATLKALKEKVSNGSTLRDCLEDAIRMHGIDNDEEVFKKVNGYLDAIHRFLSNFANAIEYDSFASAIEQFSETMEFIENLKTRL